MRIARDDELTNTQIERVAGLHRSEIPDGFLTRFGEGFLKLIYKAIVDHDKSFLIGAVENDVLLGFICGSTDTSGLYRRFARTYGLRAVRFLIPATFSIRTMRGIYETAFHPRRSEVDLPAAAILNFAVDPSCRGMGVGSRLLHALGTEFRRRGEELIRIVCGADQVAAQRLYLRNGAKEVGSMELHRGVQSKVLTWESALARGAESDGSEPTHDTRNQDSGSLER